MGFKIIVKGISLSRESHNYKYENYEKKKLTVKDK